MKIYKFIRRKDSLSFGYSRHEFPDFCFGMTKKERDKMFIVEEADDDN